MGTLRRCLDKFKKAFSKEEVDMLIEASDKYKKAGDSDLVADSKAVIDFNEHLHKEMNKLRTKVGVKSNDFKKPEVKIVEPVKEEIKVEKKPKPKKEEPKVKEKKEIEVGEEVKATPIEISDSDRGFLIDKGYDNVEINRAQKEANRILALPVLEMFRELQKKGIFNLGRGEKLDARPDLGLDKTTYNNTLRQLEEGKTTVTVKKLIDFLNQIKKDGTIPMLFDTGGMSEHKDVPLVFQLLGEDSGQEVGLSEKEEQAELEKEAAREEVFAKEGKFQKVADRKGDAYKVLDRIRKVMPKVNIVVDNKLEAAGKVQGNTLSINPYYAGLDTPIHEAGHILIDAIGFNNKVIQSAVKQLKDSPLWKETKERYPELNDEMLAKEVLAEAIGREGAGIFDKEVDKNRFKVFLDYIYTKLKQLLGIDKNVAKSLAKQIIAGIGTKELTGTTAEAQMAKVKGEKKEKSENEKEIEELLKTLERESDLSKFKYEDLLDAYNIIITSDDLPSKITKTAKNELLKRMGMNIFQRGINKVKTDPNYSEEKAIKKDIGFFDKHFKVLSHFSEAFPEMKHLSDLFKVAHFEKTKDARQLKNINEKLAIAVIKDRNKRIGIAQRGTEFIQRLFGSQNYKYFDYLDNGKGELHTIEEAKKKGFSEPQIEYLRFVREQIGARKGLFGKDAHDTAMDVLKTDKRFYENFQTENGVAAMSSLIGNSHNINKVRIKYTDPNTGKDNVSEYENVEKVLIKYGEKGIKEKAKAIALIAKYNIRARRQLKENVNADEKGESNVLNVIRKGDYSLDENGQLRSKFDKPRDKNRAYSKDFYTAMQEYIDDTQHIKHISPLVPIINAIDYINKNGVYEFDDEGNRITKHAAKENVSEWLKMWADLHVIQRPSETDPTLDATLKFLRGWTSLATMMFNVPAQGMNLAIGVYNNWRKENSKTVALGLARLFKGGFNKKAADIIHKYGAVSTDVDSNPIQTAGGALAKIGFLGTKWGEFIIQGSGLLGKLDQKDIDSFEYKKNDYGIEELVVKDTLTKEEKSALEKKILDAIDEVSDVQGKYSDKDKRNIMNNEVGKAIMQYKVWVNDWYLTRFGEKGSWSGTLLRGGFKEIKDSISDKGFMKTLASGNDTQAVKDFKSNLKGLMTTAMLMIFVYSDDDDDEKSTAAKVAQRALSDVMFVFNPNNLKFTISRPIASVSKINELLDAVIHLKDLDASKTGRDILRLTPGKKVVDIAEAITE